MHINSFICQFGRAIDRATYNDYFVAHRKENAYGSLASIGKYKYQQIDVVDCRN